METDLSSEIPQEALDIIDAAPDDPLDEWDYVNAADEGYDNRGGDLASLINSANNNGELVYCPAGDYEMESNATSQSGIIGVVGDGSDDTTIYYSGQSESTLWGGNPSTCVLDGVTFDISEEFGGEGQTDVGLLSLTVQNEGWYDDVWFVGKRAFNQNLNGSWTTVGSRFTFLAEADSGGTVYAHDCHFPDGGTDEHEAIGGTVGHAIGPNSDPGHNGYAVWHECSCSEFQDNGFYMGNSPDGINVLIDCEAINNSASNFRPGSNDMVIGGYAEQSDTPPGRHGTCIEVDSPGDATGPNETTNNVRVIGLEMVARDDHYGNEAIQLRQNVGDVYFDRCTLDVDGTNPAIRLDSRGHGTVEMTDFFCYVQTFSDSAVRVQNSEVTAENWNVYSEDGNALLVYDDGSISIDGDNYSSGTYSNADIGTEDPRPLPEFHFGDVDSPDEAALRFRTENPDGDAISDARVLVRRD